MTSRERPRHAAKSPRRLASTILALLLAAAALMSGSLVAQASPSGAPGDQTGQLTATTGGAHARYTFEYPGDGSEVSLRFTVSTADQNVTKATGVTVYGPTPGKEYASTSPDGGQTRQLSFSSRERGTYYIQIDSYYPATISYWLTPIQPFQLTPGQAQSGASGNRVVVLDPGHGGPEIGAATPQGDVVEKNLNLSIAQKVATLLRADGITVILTRDSDRAVNPRYTRGGQEGELTRDLQARVDTANTANASLFVCIHNNGGPAGESGTEVWYNKARPFADRNLKLAQLLQSNLLTQVRGLGYNVRDRGIKDDSRFRVVNGQLYNLFVLGPGTNGRVHTPTQMPGVLGESLFISNPSDANMLRQPATIDAIARGYRDAIVGYFQVFGS